MKGVHLFKSQITKSMYEDFLLDLKFKNSSFDSSPFVYVDPENGTISLLAGSMTNPDGEYNAISVQHKNAASGRSE